MSVGRWFIAVYQSDCSWGDVIEEGDEIRADGEGGWEHQACAEIHGCGLEADPSEEDDLADELFGL